IHLALVGAVDHVLLMSAKIAPGVEEGALQAARGIVAEAQIFGFIALFQEAGQWLHPAAHEGLETAAYAGNLCPVSVVVRVILHERAKRGDRCIMMAPPLPEVAGDFGAITKVERRRSTVEGIT